MIPALIILTGESGDSNPPQRTMILQCMTKPVTEVQLTGLQTVIAGRLKSMNVRDFRISANKAKAQLVIRLRDTVKTAELEQVLCASGKLNVFETLGAADILTQMNNLQSSCLLKVRPLMHWDDPKYSRGPVILGCARPGDTSLVVACLNSAGIRAAFHSEIRFIFSRYPADNEQYDLYCASVANPVFNESIITDVHPDFSDPRLPVLSVSFTETNWKAWETFTSGNIDKVIVFVLDGKVVFAPRVQGAISGGRNSITGGGLNRTEVLKLNAILANGVLPCPLGIAVSE